MEKAQMNPDDFEKRLQRQPLRQIPGEWRAEILSTAQQASFPDHTSRITHHALQLSALLWPHPAAWAGLAAVWLLILGFNLTTRDASQVAAKHAASVPPQVFMAFQEQERLLSELIGPRDTPVAERPKPRLPRPRSEARKEMLLAQIDNAATKPREAFGVRPACWRCLKSGEVRKREQAPRTPNASRGNSSTENLTAWEQIQLGRA
jgi:hypothetical protein